MAKTADIFKAFKKDHGDTRIIKGSDCQDCVRVPFGVFPFDLATGGGLVQGKINMIFGIESSGKSTIALLWVANFQKNNPGKVCVWIDAEWSFDKLWAVKLGVDVFNLIVFKPICGEEVIDITEGLVGTDDLGILVLDSLANMVPINELEGAGDRVQVGGNTILIGRFYRKVIMAMGENISKGNYPTVLCINQMRYKIGVMFGNPESILGGMAPKHFTSMIIKVYGVDEIVKEVDAKVPVLKKITMSIYKNKVPIVAKTAEFKMAIVAHKNLKVGQVDSWNTILAYSKDYGYLSQSKNKDGWLFNGLKFSSQNAVVDYLKKDDDLLTELKERIINDAIEAVGGGGTVDK